MKKLLLFTLLFFTVLFVDYKPVNASIAPLFEASDDFAVSCVEDPDHLLITGEFPETIKAFTIHIPKEIDDYEPLLTNGDEIALKMYLLDDTTLKHTLLNGFDLLEDDPFWAPAFDYMDITIDFQAYAVTESVNNFEFVIPVAECNNDVVTYGNENIVYSYTYQDPLFGTMRFGDFDVVPKDGSLYYNLEVKSNYIPIPENTNAIDFYSSALLNYTGEEWNLINYYDEDYNLVRTYPIINFTGDDYWHDFFPYDEEGDPRHGLANLAWSFFNYDVSNEVKFIQFEGLDFNPSYVLSKTINYNLLSYYYLDGDYIRVNFIIDGQIWENYIGVVGGFTNYNDIPPTIEGKTFAYFVDADGNVFDNISAITLDMVNNKVVNFYGIYFDTPTTVNPDVEDPTADASSFEILLADLGFNDGPERVIIFSVIILLVTLVLFAKGVAVFSVLIVDAIILAFFMSLGLLPVFVSAILIIVLIFFGYFYMRGGVSSE